MNQKTGFGKIVLLLLLGQLLMIASGLTALAEEPPAVAGNAEQQLVPAAEQDPRAVVKEGFFSGIADERVSLDDMNTGRKSSYRLEENYLIFQDEAVITLDDIPPHSIVKLVLIEGQVREIILLLRSS